MTGVTSTRNIDLIRSLGADHVVDYTTTDFVRTGQRYDVIIDTIGNRSVSDLKKCACRGRQGRRYWLHQRGEADGRFAARGQ